HGTRLLFQHGADVHARFPFDDQPFLFWLVHHETETSLRNPAYRVPLMRAVLELEICHIPWYARNARSQTLLEAATARANSKPLDSEAKQLYDCISEYESAWRTRLRPALRDMVSRPIHTRPLSLPVELADLVLQYVDGSRSPFVATGHET